MTRTMGPERAQDGAARAYGGVLGAACVAGGLLVAASGVVLELEASDGLGSVTADTALARSANGLFAAAVLGLMCGVVGLRATGLGGGGRLARTGTPLALLGLLLWTVGGLYLTADASADQPFTPIGGIVASLGMVMLGTAVLREGAAVRGRYAPLLVGAWFFVQLPVQGALFLSDGGTPSFVLLLGVLGALWALTGLTVRSAAAGRP